MKILDEPIDNVRQWETTFYTPPKIKVLLIITGLAIGGATNVVLDIGTHFNHHPDFEIKLLTGPIPPGRCDATYMAYEKGIPTEVVPSLFNQINPLVNTKALSDIRRIIVRGDYDIVHTHSTVAGVIGRVAAASSGTPVIIHHIHGWAFCNDIPLLTRFLCLNLEKLCARFTSQLIAVSRSDIQKGLANGIGSEDKFTLINNGIDLEKFRQPVADQLVRSELGLRPDSKLVGMIGRLDKQKNPLDFIRAADIVVKEYPNTQFVFVGDGLLRSECQQLIDELDLNEKVKLLGFRNDVNRILPILTVSAMSSLWEGQPLAFIESMSAGKPIVANDVDGAKDIVINGETGFLVPPHQPQEMANRILCLLADEVLCAKMGSVAQQRSNYFPLNRMVRQVESLYRELYYSSQTWVDSRKKSFRFRIAK